MKCPVDDMIPSIGIEIINNGTELETCVYRKLAKSIFKAM